MGRAGAGGGDSGGYSSGGHSNDRISGGHHVSSGGSGDSHRAGNYRTSSGYSDNDDLYDDSGFINWIFDKIFPSWIIVWIFDKIFPEKPSPSPPPGEFDFTMGSYRPSDEYLEKQKRKKRDETLQSLIIMLVTGLFALFCSIVFIGFIALVSGIGSGGSSVPKSSYNRERINTGVAFQNDCIVDEIGWFDNIPKVERRIRYFYKETGIQPYIVLHKYDSSLTTDAEKEAYAKKYYADNIKNEGTFLFMYFAEQDTDDDVGYMCYVNGKQVTSVMDSEAVEIFWAYVDNNWYSNMSTDDMFVTIFDKTADRIMTKTTTGADVGKKVVTLLILIVVFSGVLVVMRVRRKHEHERAEETERILNTPLRSSEDDLADKYLNK